MKISQTIARIPTWIGATLFAAGLGCLGIALTEPASARDFPADRDYIEEIHVIDRRIDGKQRDVRFNDAETMQVDLTFAPGPEKRARLETLRRQHDALAAEISGLRDSRMKIQAEARREDERRRAMAIARESAYAQRATDSLFLE